MHHPGPPRFVAVGESTQLAPRDPDPDADYWWRIRSAPVASQAELGDDPVVTFEPDAAGRYTVELTAPDGTHELTVRAFPGDLAPVGAGSGYSGTSGFASGSARPSGRSGGVSGSGSGAGSGGGGEGRPRVHLSGRVEGDEVVIEADPQRSPDSSKPRDELGVEFLVDDRDDVDDSAVRAEGWELRVPLDAFGDRVRVHAVAVGESYSVADAVEVRKKGDGVDVSRTDAEEVRTSSGSDARTDGGVATEGESTADADADAEADVEIRNLNQPPEWATEATLYEIYVRGFAADDEETDNTFEAIENRLDYLADLGVDTLWLTPVLQNDHAPHGYNIVDFFSIAEDLGTREDYEALVDAAHDRGMRVLFDLVLNHSARDHPYFEKAKAGDSEYRDWYEWNEDGSPGTYFDWEYIANFDHTNLEVRRYLLNAVDEWMAVADGFRCDMAWAVPDSFWTEIRERVKSRDPEFLLLDETIPYIADFHEMCFDIHFDTTLYFTLRQVGRGDAPADAVLDALQQRREVGFPDHAAFMLYVENHDETRYVVECGEPEAYAAAGALFTLPGVPMIYGGQELGQRGKRDPLAWEHANDELRDHYRRLVEVRDSMPALGYEGRFREVEFEADSDRAVAFVRETDAESYLCALNFGAGEAVVGVDAELDPTDVVSGESVADENGVRVDDVIVVPLAE